MGAHAPMLWAGGVLMIALTLINHPLQFSIPSSCCLYWYPVHLRLACIYAHHHCPEWPGTTLD